MNKNKSPLRMCVACRKMFEKNNMIKVVKIDDNICLDKTNKLNGRSAYICNNKQCVELTIKKKLLNKSFKKDVGNLVYTELKEYDVAE